MSELELEEQRKKYEDELKEAIAVAFKDRHVPQYGRYPRLVIRMAIRVIRVNRQAATLEWVVDEVKGLQEKLGALDEKQERNRENVSQLRAKVLERK